LAMCALEHNFKRKPLGLKSYINEVCFVFLPNTIPKYIL
jgi:hypothetical protein